jgi:hypothetical protein
MTENKIAQNEVDKFLRSEQPEKLKLTLLDRAILFALAARISDKENCYPSQTFLAAYLGVERRSIIRSINKLKQSKLLNVVRQKNKSNVYFLNLPVDKIGRCDTQSHTTALDVTLGHMVCDTQSHQEPKNTFDVTLGHTNINNNIYNKRKEKIKKEKKSIEDVALPDWLDKIAWQNFVNFRKEIKKPLTHFACLLNIKRLQNFKERGQDVVKVIEQSIANGWQGLFDLRPDRNEFCGRATNTELKSTVPDYVPQKNNFDFDAAKKSWERNKEKMLSALN